MSVEKMKMVSIIGKYEELDSAIQAYLDSGCFHPENASQLVENVKGFTMISEENPYSNSLNRLREILDAANVKPKPIANTGPTPPIEEIDAKMKIIDERLGSLQKQKQAIDDKIVETKELIEKLSHFVGIGIDLTDLTGSEYVRTRFGKLPTESYEKLKYYKSNPYIVFTPCSSDGDFLWGAYITPADCKEEIDNIFNSLFFERLHLPHEIGTPSEAVVSYKEKLKKLENDSNQLKQIISEFNELELNDYLVLYTQLNRAYDSFEIRKFATKYGDSFMLVGWIPESDIKHFSKYMDLVDSIEYTFEDPDEESAAKPPIKLKNPRFAKPFEYYVEMFGVPGYKEFDPTAFMAITYTLLYGIMFADVGQGLILALVGFIMYKFKNMPLGRIIIPCGICGSLFGLVFGSVFGFEELLDPLYKKLGISFLPIKVMDSINNILISAVGIGVVMMILAISLNIYSCIKRRDFGEALVSENGLCGLLLYVSIIILILGMVADILPFLALPAVITIIVTALLIMFKEPLIHLINRKKFVRESSMAEYIMQSFFETFEALLSYITNTVSFLRVGAFVLVHNGMMMVFFTLAGMMSNSVLSGVVIVIGNILVLVLEGLLVGIQSLRLEFYEMFSRFYQGEGKPYEPAQIDVVKK